MTDLDISVEWHAQLSTRLTFLRRSSVAIEVLDDSAFETVASRLSHAASASATLGVGSKYPDADRNWRPENDNALSSSQSKMSAVRVLHGVFSGTQHLLETLGCIE